MSDVNQLANQIGQTSIAEQEGVPISINDLPPQMQEAARATVENVATQQLADIKDLLSVLQPAAIPAKPEKKDDHKFWKTQPVQDFDDPSAFGPIEADKTPEEIRPEPYKLPAGFQWSDVDMSNDEQSKELYELLSGNYVEDGDAYFRFDYSREFLQWALQPPGFVPEWLVGIRLINTGRLVAFISGVPMSIRTNEVTHRMPAINFLCIHKKLRSKRLAPVLIKEITRRVHQTGIFQAIYTAGVRIPRPVSSVSYYHRPLNYQKLMDVGFVHPGTQLLSSILRQYRLPKTVALPHFRPMRPEDVPQVTALWADASATRYNLTAEFTEEEVAHSLIPRDKLVYTYVVEAPPATAGGAPGPITDMVSFYSLPSLCLGHPVHRTLNAAYLYYYVSTATPVADLVRGALIEASNAGFDVFNCLDIMTNSEFFSQLDFGVGDGTLNFYLYNWAMPTVPGGKVSVVLP
ncbi:hypothetical protein H696_00300 [Fonticula alba]|uniref:Glycylpeptide N-tetradecanoyltransferase n=1 Tax=Fonticula alba TaxID=691883 RepID=A0A058ZGV7_FONAL|nr:hypothetical protein H696_00300 [Fonticula alba]KCV72722.1 hypothetical protein H696_00300 [Fonticula alba]|eukprot:XP_009492423.1 hypothetical protein H696_00300 [Fonticula alba]